MEGLGDGGDAFGIESKAVEHGRGEAGVFAGVEIDGIGIGDGLLVTEDALGHGSQAAVLIGSGQEGELSGS